MYVIGHDGRVIRPNKSTTIGDCTFRGGGPPSPPYLLRRSSQGWLVPIARQRLFFQNSAERPGQRQSRPTSLDQTW